MQLILTLSPILLLGALALMARIIRPANIRRDWLLSTAIVFLCICIDAIMLVLLPKLGLSFGPFTALFFFSLGRLGILVIGLALLRSQPSFPKPGFNLRFFATIQLILLCLAFYGLYIEPFRLGVTYLPVQSSAFFPNRPLRILQITDLHVERITVRERAMLEKIEALQPDIIVLTGDYLNIDYKTDPQSIADGHIILSQLHAPYGVYAISGSPPVDLPEVMPALFNGTDIRLLNDEVATVQLPGGALAILGVSWKTDDGAQILEKLQSKVPENSFTLLLHHSPDLIKPASQLGISLYLAGHTHGGQVRLPFYGAMVTFARTGKSYEMGKYSVASTILYVSRGIGMEGLNMPRLRFLAPPELVLIELGTK